MKIKITIKKDIMCSTIYNYFHNCFHNNLNKPSVIIFSTYGEIIACYFDRYDDNNKCSNLHRTNGCAVNNFEAKIFEYYLNDKKYSKIEYYLKLASEL